MKFGKVNVYSSLDTAISEDKASILEFDIKEFNELKLWLINLGLKSDYMLLISAFRKSYDRKQAWRKMKDKL